MAKLYVPGIYTLRRLLQPERKPADAMGFSEPPVRTSSVRQRALNLGCGNDYMANEPNREWVNADISRNVKADVYFDAFQVPYPLESGSFDLVKAYDFLEHIPHTLFDAKGQRIPTDGFFVVMDEIFRILKPGGVLEARFPAFLHRNNYIDPTHTRQILRETFENTLVKTGPYSFYTNQHWELVSYDDALPDNHYARLRKPA